MSVRYRNHTHELRDLAQLTGENVVPFNPRAPWPCEDGKEPPAFLKKEPANERTA